MTAFDALLVVQDRDTELDQLNHRRAHLPQRAALAQARSARRQIETRGAEAAAARSELESRRTSLEKEVADLSGRLADLDRRLRSGEVTATRELTAMVDQSEALKRRRAELEDAELELMVAEEPLDQELRTLEEQWAAVTGEISSLEAEIAEAEASIDAEVDRSQEARVAAAAELGETLLSTYERLRARLGGVGAARLIGASCGGCHLTLPATELDRIRREPPDALVTCDHCGRILVR